MKYLKKYEEVIKYDIKNLDKVFNDCKIFIEDLKKCDKGTFLTRGVGDYLTGENYGIEKFEHDISKRTPRDMDMNIHTLLNQEFNKVFGWNVRNGLFCFGKKYKDHFSDLLTGYGAETYILFPIDNYEIVWNDNIIDLYSNFENEIYGEVDDEDANEEYNDKYYEGGDGEYYCNDKTTEEHDKDFAKEIIVNNYEDFGYEWDKDEYEDEDDFKEFIYDDCELEWKPDMEYYEWYDDYVNEQQERIENDVKNLVNNYEEGYFIEAVKSGSEICINCKNYYLINTSYAQEIIKKIWE